MKEPEFSIFNRQIAIKYGILSFIGSLLCFVLIYFFYRAASRGDELFRKEFAYVGIVAMLILFVLGSLLLLLSHNFLMGTVQQKPVSSSILVSVSLILFSISTFVFVFTFVLHDMPKTLGGLKTIFGGYFGGIILLWRVYRRRSTRTHEDSRSKEKAALI